MALEVQAENMDLSPFVASRNNAATIPAPRTGRLSPLQVATYMALQITSNDIMAPSRGVPAAVYVVPLTK